MCEMPRHCHLLVCLTNVKKVLRIHYRSLPVELDQADGMTPGVERGPAGSPGRPPSLHAGGYGEQPGVT